LVSGEERRTGGACCAAPSIAEVLAERGAASAFLAGFSRRTPAAWSPEWLGTTVAVVGVRLCVIEPSASVLDAEADELDRRRGSSGSSPTLGRVVS
jgi:hypothetical protein